MLSFTAKGALRYWKVILSNIKDIVETQYFASQGGNIKQRRKLLRLYFL